jgi:hypothetical protein
MTLVTIPSTLISGMVTAKQRDGKTREGLYKYGNE